MYFYKCEKLIILLQNNTIVAFHIDQSNVIDHVTTILTAWLFIVVGKKPSAQCNVHWAEPIFTWEKSILNDILALGFDLDM